LKKIEILFLLKQFHYITVKYYCTLFYFLTICFFEKAVTIVAFGHQAETVSLYK